MHEYDDDVLKAFLKNQSKLFDEDVAETLEEAEAFLEDCLAVVVDSLQEVWDYFDENGVDLEGMALEDIEDASDYSDTPVMVGLEITDPDMIKKLGYTNLWPDSAPSVVIGMYCDTTDVATCEKVMIAVLGDAI